MISLISDSVEVIVSSFDDVAFSISEIDECVLTKYTKLLEIIGEVTNLYKGDKPYFKKRTSYLNFKNFVRAAYHDPMEKSASTKCPIPIGVRISLMKCISWYDIFIKENKTVNDMLTYILKLAVDVNMCPDDCATAIQLVVNIVDSLNLGSEFIRNASLIIYDVKHGIYYEHVHHILSQIYNMLLEYSPRFVPIAESIYEDVHPLFPLFPHFYAYTANDIFIIFKSLYKCGVGLPVERYTSALAECDKYITSYNSGRDHETGIISYDKIIEKIVHYIFIQKPVKIQLYKYLRYVMSSPLYKDDEKVREATMYLACIHNISGKCKVMSKSQMDEIVKLIKVENDKI